MLLSDDYKPRFNQVKINLLLPNSTVIQLITAFSTIINSNQKIEITGKIKELT